MPYLDISTHPMCSFCARPPLPSRGVKQLSQESNMLKHPMNEQPPRTNHQNQQFSELHSSPVSIVCIRHGSMLHSIGSSQLPTNTTHQSVVYVYIISYHIISYIYSIHNIIILYIPQTKTARQGRGSYLCCIVILLSIRIAGRRPLA